MNEDMKTLKAVFVLFLSIFLLGCPFEENRKVEKMLADSVNNFHILFNQEKFKEIYLGMDDELKNRFTEQQFVSYLEVVKNDIGEINTKPLISIKDDLKDGVKRFWSKKTKFSNSDLISTEKAIYVEKIEWNIKDNEAKISNYEVNKLCNKPCKLSIGTELN
jgi:hypothetical protein